MNKFATFNIKIALLLSGIIIVILVLLYTQFIVGRIQNREKQIANLYAKSLEYLANAENESGEYNFIFTEIVTQIDFPLIATDKDYKEITILKNVEYDSTRKLTKQDTARFFELAHEMAEINPPIKVTFQDSIVLTLVHYGQSSLVTELKILPYIEFIIGGLFLFLGYIGFSYIKRNEQSNIWVGLSRETAHQLGTPLSSLMGWLELLKTTEPKTPELETVTHEIENDLEKLNKIAGRFSKIGSQPKMEKENLKNLIDKVAKYFERRIPTLTTEDGKKTKKVNIEINGPDDIEAAINKDLFEWVIENLMKNALDAMDKPAGKIIVDISRGEKDICIDVTDTGKGIDSKFKKDIFRPGYSTKQRGWGLGLSLSKRIIEDYHRGKLILFESEIDKGSIFRIKLQKNLNGL